MSSTGTGLNTYLTNNSYWTNFATGFPGATARGATSQQWLNRTVYALYFPADASWNPGYDEGVIRPMEEIQQNSLFQPVKTTDLGVEGYWLINCETYSATQQQCVLPDSRISKKRADRADNDTLVG